MKKRLISLTDFRHEVFEDRISRRTIQHWCVNGHLPAQKIGYMWFVDMNAFERMSGNELVDSVLAA